MQGLNISISVIRRVSGTDSIGGATYTTSTVATAKARLGNASRSQQMALREMGYESLRANEIIAQPSDLNVKENDYVQIVGGQWDGVQFIVRSVRRDNLLPTDARSHVELLVERMEEAKSVP